MWLFLKSALIISVSFVTGILVSFGIVPERAIAPHVSVPVPFEEQIAGGPPESSETPAESASASVDADAKEVETSEHPPVSERLGTPLIDDYRKSLQEALDALAQLQAAQQPAVSASALNDTARNAVVNVFCTTAGAGPVNPISASGVIIDPRGIVLTNAHVGQYFLIKNYPVPGFIDCTLRTGSPARPAYTASLLFLPPSWIAKNAQKIVDRVPTGNGEHDYAFLQITGTISGEAMPPLTALPLVADRPELGDSVLLAAYPAGFLGGITIAQDLYAASANVNIEKAYTFDTDTLDLFSIGGSIVAQQGSSGGAAAQATTASPSGAALLGLIVTSSIAEDTASRELRALSTEYIIRDFAAERGIPLRDYLARDPENERARFELTTAPTLTAALVSALER